MNPLDEWVSAEFQRLAEVINDYDHYLFLEMVPVAEQHLLNDKSKCFRIMDDRTKTIVMYAKSTSTPVDILEALWSRDLKHGDVVARMDKRNAAIEALAMRKWLDDREERKDFSAFILKNEKNTWQHEGRKYDDEFRDKGSVRKHIT